MSTSTSDLPTLIVAAAGRGLRFGGDVPKQFRILGANKRRKLPMLCCSLYAFIGQVGKIVISAAPEHCELVRKYLAKINIGCPYLVVTGGATRQQSVALALEHAGNPEYTLVHDAARPLVKQNSVVALMKVLRNHDAAILAQPSYSTVKRVDPERRIVLGTEDRRTIWLAQTPQGFRTEVGRMAFARAIAAGEDHPDEAAVLAAAGVPVQVVPGLTDNLKITTPEDLGLAEALLRIELPDIE